MGILILIQESLSRACIRHVTTPLVTKAVERNDTRHSTCVEQQELAKQYFKIPYIGHFSGVAQQRARKLINRFCARFIAVNFQTVTLTMTDVMSKNVCWNFKKNRIFLKNFYIFAAVSTIWIIYLFHLVSLCKFCFVIYRHIVPRGEGPNCPWAESYLLCSTRTSFTLSVLQNTQSKKDSKVWQCQTWADWGQIKLVSKGRVKKN